MLQRNVLDYLERTAARFPDKTAFADEKESFTFAQLLSAARSLGTYIIKNTSRRNAPVMVMTDRTAVSIAAFMGVLYSGNFYVPVDNKMPLARMSSIAEQLKPAAVVFAGGDRSTAESVASENGSAGRSDGAHSAPGGSVPLLLLDMVDGFACEPDEELLAQRRASGIDTDPVYAIFTSGSTGRPKGIVISHRSVIDFTEWFTEAGRFTSDDIMGNQAPFYFDLSVKDIYTVLKCGATAYIIPKKLFMFPKLLMGFLQEKNVTALVWATSAFHLVANSGILEKMQLPSLRTAMLGGEALYAKQLNKWRRAMPDARYVNLYGPTEVTVDCTCYPIEREFSDDEVIPVGRACANKEVFLLDEKRARQCAPGEPGEICVRGSGIARGYFGEWEKTGAAFIQDPRNTDYPETVYCTGDIAVEDADGCLRFVSRRDGQIKHMGYRIELGEIEAALSGIPEIDEIACVFDAAADRIICVFTGAADDKALAKEARSRLPRYMVPNIYKKPEAMPHNANGKIDRPALKRVYVDAAE